MPQVTVYVRKANLAKWEAMANKAEWLNTLLENSDDTSNYGATIQTPVGPAVTVLSETLPDKPKLITADKLESLEPTLAPCCKKSSPCRHWQFNELDGNWMNSLTGDVREA